MTDITTTTNVPEFPMTRAPGCPFAPPPESLALNATKQLSRVRIWDGSTPWLIHGYDA
ncbi:MAG TPA: cytochrome P450, partial [Mycobacterium sp.]|nr:cytochrome P450 [Mycobacterium sp.]